MANKQVQTTYNKEAGNWRNKSAGASRASGIYDTKAEARAAGRQQAINRKAEHIVHNMNGKIGSRNSYGSDPHPPLG